MNDLVEFLRARIAEDEAVALRVFDLDDPVGTVMTLALGPGWITPPGWGVNPGGVFWKVSTGPERVVFARAREWAECEAKRRIVNRIIELDAASNAVDNIEPSYGAAVELLCLLALPYADHPDYRDEWRPE